MDIHEFKYIGEPKTSLGMRVLPENFVLTKNSEPVWNIRYIRFGRKFYIEPVNGDAITFHKRWFFLELRDLVVNGQKQCSFFHKATKIGATKLWVDSRSFIYLGNEKICSIDPWTPNWPGDNLTFYKWEHSNTELELKINILALMAAVDYADRY